MFESRPEIHNPAEEKRLQEYLKSAPVQETFSSSVRQVLQNYIEGDREAGEDILPLRDILDRNLSEYGFQSMPDHERERVFWDLVADALLANAEFLEMLGNKVETGGAGEFKEQLLGVIKKLSPTAYRSHSQRAVAFTELSRKFDLLAPRESPDRERGRSNASSPPGKHPGRQEEEENADLYQSEETKPIPKSSPSQDEAVVAPFVPGLIEAAFQRMKEDTEKARKMREAKLVNPPAFPRLKALRDVVLGMEDEYGRPKKSQNGDHSEMYDVAEGEWKGAYEAIVEGHSRIPFHMLVPGLEIEFEKLGEHAEGYRKEINALFEITGTPQFKGQHWELSGKIRDVGDSRWRGWQREITLDDWGVSPDADGYWSTYWRPIKWHMKPKLVDRLLRRKTEEGESQPE